MLPYIHELGVGLGLGMGVRDGFRVQVTNRVSVRDRGGLGFIRNDGIQ